MARGWQARGTRLRLGPCAGASYHVICNKRAPRARRAPGSCLRRAAARAAQLRSAASAGQSVVHRRTGPVLRCARPHPPTASHVKNADTRLGQPSPCPSFWRISAPAVSPRQGPCPPPELSLGARSSSPLRLTAHCSTFDPQTLSFSGPSSSIRLPVGVSVWFAARR